MSRSDPAVLASGPQTHARVFDSSGRLVRYRLGANVRDLRYDAADRISAYTHYNASTGAAQPTLNQSFNYDALGRLTQTTLASGAWSFSYDANGNRTATTVSGSTSNYTTAATSNRITSITNPSRSFAYDSAGNTTNDGKFSATYDLAGRMATLTKAGVTSTYSYDGFGRRVRKFNSTGVASAVIFVYDQNGQLLSELDSTGAAIREYVWLGSTPIAVFTPDPVSATNPPLVFYVHADHLDTPRVIVDKNNAIRWRWMAEPFGVNAPEVNPSGLGVFTFNLRFPGQYFDQESGLHYNWFRSYDSSIGRYISSDPIGLAGGINTFSYVGGNPLSYVDPNGLCQCLAVPDSKQSQSIPRWYGHDRVVTGRYVCETNDNKKETVPGTHKEWYAHKDKNDTGREGNLLGQLYGTATFNSFTYTYTYPQAGFKSFDPLSSPSPDLNSWAKRCNCK